MQVDLNVTLSDPQVALAQSSSQRQMAIAIAALAGSRTGRSAPLNLCLILDQSGSMGGAPMETVKQAALRLLEKLSVGDRLSVISFDHQARILIPNQVVANPATLRPAIAQLAAAGGTAIDEGLRLGIEEFSKGKGEAVSQGMLLTDGENEHGSNERCLKFAKLAADYGLTINTLGFGDHWNQDVLEQIADAGGGSLTHIERSEDVLGEFSKLFERIQTVGLTNAHLVLELSDKVALAKLKPVAQVSPDVIELEPLSGAQANQLEVRLGDLMVDLPRQILVNLYVQQLPEGTHTIGTLRVRYDDPSTGETQLLSEPVAVTVTTVQDHQPQTDAGVQQQVLALAKYRQTQIAEQKLQTGDRTGAATMLQTAAQTALQMGDQRAATVLQENATRLQSGEELSESDRKKTRMASKTMLQPLPETQPLPGEGNRSE
ncbi:MAG: VWA domain-containing protein [Synechococcales cyanobacterium RU_4_20]|nr:VWA domain-containing protein [Synechococcales cyanobacterium RU_4_20]NJR67693.1 VWA domain-containing protein [Synechococcales cyanobacterium CRU_2_2]